MGPVAADLHGDPRTTGWPLLGEGLLPFRANDCRREESGNGRYDLREIGHWLAADRLLPEGTPLDLLHLVLSEFVAEPQGNGLR